MYACGPTVYDFAHIGNARMAVVSDQLVRVLRQMYPKVTYVSNITDVDDKILVRAESQGVSIQEVTEKYAKIYNEDMACLGVLAPDYQPKATDYIPQMIDMIQVIIDQGGGYAQAGHVYFDVTSFDAYGGLSGRSLDQLTEGVRISVSGNKKQPGDFVLWKPSDDHEVGWDSPWGRGRPGWHIECSAMSSHTLNLPFDIHAGGVDLVFPHHENEIAQACCARGESALDAYAKYWVHNGFVMHEGQKMSKSIGNILLVHDLIQQHAPAVLRLMLLQTHYRQPLNWTNSGLESAKVMFQKMLDIFEFKSPKEGKVDPEIWEALMDDLNTPLALVRMNALMKQIRDNGYEQNSVDTLCASAKLLGLLDADSSIVAQKIASQAIERLLSERELARQNKDYAKADKIRDELSVQGVEILDGVGGSTWKYKL